MDLHLVRYAFLCRNEVSVCIPWIGSPQVREITKHALKDVDERR